MNVSYQTNDKASALLTITLVKADYQENVEKTLKKIRKDAQMPGFRKGMVPAGMIKKAYGPNVEIDEVNKLLGETINNYLQENKIQVLGEPLPNAEQKQIDFDAADEYVFLFDLALKPEVNVEVSADDKIPYYEITITDELVDQQINALAQRNGKNKSVGSYQDKDMVKGNLTELDENGQPKEGGLVVADALMLPTYFKNEDEKAKFEGAEKGSSVVLNIYNAWDGNGAEMSGLLKMSKEEAVNVKSDFSFEITELSRYEAASVDQDLFDSIYGPGVIASEDEFRSRITEDMKTQFASDADFKFFMDARKAIMEKVGQLEFSEPMVKRIMKVNNPDKDDKFIDDNYDQSIEALSWQFVRDELCTKLQVTVNDQDVMASARLAVRAQLAQYGIQGVSEATVENYAKEMLKNRQTVEELIGRCLNDKLGAALKEVVTLERQEISLEDFNKSLEA